MKTLPGLTQVSTDLEIKQPQLNIEILRDKASALNLSAADIENALSYAFSASNLSPINDPEYQYYAILELEPKFYSDPSLLSQLYIRSSTNKLVPLSAATRQSQTVGPLNINRFNGLPAVNIFFDVGTNALGPAVAKIEKLAHQTLPSYRHRTSPRNRRCLQRLVCQSLPPAHDHLLCDLHHPRHPL